MRIAQIQQTLFMSDFIVAAQPGVGCIVGVARSLTDFSYCCYVSDLRLIVLTSVKGSAGACSSTPRRLLVACSVVLIAMLKREFYLHIGMQRHAAHLSIAGSYKPFMKEFK